MHAQSFFATLADPTRFRIVELLRDGEQAVSDLVARMEVHQSGVSRHLGILLELGLVRVRREGQHRFYALRAEPFRDIEAWAGGYRRHWEARLDRLESALAHKARPRGTGRTRGDRQ